MRILYIVCSKCLLISISDTKESILETYFHLRLTNIIKIYILAIYIYFYNFHHTGVVRAWMWIDLSQVFRPLFNIEKEHKMLHILNKKSMNARLFQYLNLMWIIYITGFIDHIDNNLKYYWTPLFFVKCFIKIFIMIGGWKTKRKKKRTDIPLNPAPLICQGCFSKPSSKSCRLLVCTIRYWTSRQVSKGL